MSLISLPRMAARTGTRVLGAALHAATFPTRTAAHVCFEVVEAVLDLLERTELVEPATAPPERSSGPRLRREPPGVARRRHGEGAPIPPVRPSVASAPRSKRRASTPGIPAAADLSVPAVPAEFEPGPAEGAPARTAGRRAAAPADSAGAPAADAAPPPPDAMHMPSPSTAPADAEPAGPTAAAGHVETEATLVAESADPGAEEGAGASVRVEAPWPNYGQLTAKDVVDRLPVQDDAVISLLLLYERTHRGRRSVIAAAERELARRAAPARR